MTKDNIIDRDSLQDECVRIMACELSKGEVQNIVYEYLSRECDKLTFDEMLAIAETEFPEVIESLKTDTDLISVLENNADDPMGIGK
jgi:hypothetical protein